MRTHLSALINNFSFSPEDDDLYILNIIKFLDSSELHGYIRAVFKEDDVCSRFLNMEYVDFFEQIAKKDSIREQMKKTLQFNFFHNNNSDSNMTAMRILYILHVKIPIDTFKCISKDDYLMDFFAFSNESIKVQQSRNK